MVMGVAICLHYIDFWGRSASEVRGGWGDRDGAENADRGWDSI
jgi:hypothetical protein